MWEVRIQHEGLRAFRVLKGPTQADAQWKATAQLRLWDARWSALQRAESARNDLLTRQMLALHGRRTAARFTAEAAARNLALESILAASLQRGLFFQWDLLKDQTVFAAPPIPLDPPRTPPPQLLKELYAPQLTALDKFHPARRARKEREANEIFERHLAAWRTACFRSNERAVADFCRRLDERRRNRMRHHTAQLAQHAKVEETKAAFECHEKNAVEYYFAEVLSRSPYPIGFPEEARVQYLQPTRTLIVEYELPSFDVWPRCRQVNYIASQNTLQEVTLPELAQKSSYESALYQITLRAISEIFSHDYSHAVERIAFNGWLRSVDKSVGNLAHGCMLSIMVGRPAFLAVNLSQVDPRSCFRRLSGVASSRPIDLVAVKPVVSLAREEDHFATSPTTLYPAPVDGSEFEALTHEAFESVFHKTRSQVRLAQVARDTVA
jgi:restriction system protein